MNNIENFDALAAYIFADLYEQFPVVTEIKPQKYLGELIEEYDFDGSWTFPEFADATFDWLSKCEYIFLEKESGLRNKVSYKATLAPRAFDVMRQPSPLDPKKPLGESIRNTISEKSMQGLGIVVSAALSSSTSAVFTQ